MTEHQRMTRVMTCDRCQTTREYQFQTNTANTGQTTITPESTEDYDGMHWAHMIAKKLLETGNRDEGYDLCPACKHSFRQWWRDGRSGDASR
jgi:protein-arginine kinase activator protein McsA